MPHHIAKPADNGIGFTIQEYSDDTGWVNVGEPFTTDTEADTARAAIPQDGIQRRTYELLKGY